MNNYKLLSALASLLQTRNISQSASELNITQSAMSKTLSQIREAFGDPILIREGNQYMLSQRGEHLKQQLPQLLGQLDGLYMPEALDLKTCQRTFVMASSDYVAQSIYPIICARAHEQAPHIRLDYQLWDKKWLAELSTHPIDLVSTITTEVPENLHGKPMAQDKSVVLLRQDHPLANRTLTKENYASAAHLIISGGGDKHSMVDDALALNGLKRQIYAIVPFFQSAVELLRQTDTLLTIPIHIAADFARRYQLQLKPLPFEVPNHHYYLLWHSKYQLDPGHRWLRELAYPILASQLQLSISEGMKLIHDN